MRKLWNIAFWVLGTLLILVTLSFSSTHLEQNKVSGPHILVDYSNEHYFVAEQEIEDIVRKTYPYFDSLLVREININLLEESIDNHPCIRKAEVYSTITGSLEIRVQQKKPHYRVVNSKGGYYVDEQGDSMALSPHFSATVPLVTGLLTSQSRKEVHEFLEQMQQNSFYKNFFTGIEVSDNGEWILYPKLGKHKVILGKPENIDTKMGKLKRFYTSVVASSNIDSIALLNLKYQGQVVCTKH